MTAAPADDDSTPGAVAPRSRLAVRSCLLAIRSCLAAVARGRGAVALFFGLYLAAGLAVHADYGVSWDEEINREAGRSAYTYVAARLSGDEAAWSNSAHGMAVEYGPFFEFLLYAVEVASGVTDSRDVMLLRHAATFVAFWIGTLAFYAMLHRRHDDRLLALGGTALLVLSPRLFAHSFYNSKDAALAALVMIAMWTLARLLERPTWPRLLAHAAACAAPIAVRVAALVLPVATLVGLALCWAGASAATRSGPEQPRALGRRLLAAGAGYVAALPVFVVLLWPALWSDPVGAVARALTRATRAPQLANSQTLYLGEFVPVDALPWHYLPVWMAVTIAPLTLALFLVGLLACARHLLRAGGGRQQVHAATMLLLCALPVAGALLLRPVLYDGWRHFYFVYPAMIAIAACGWAALRERPATARLAILLLPLALAHGVAVLVRTHPYQMVYFNVLAGRDVEHRFELDYWGLSFREGLEFVLDTDPSQTVRVAASDYPGALNSRILEPARRARLSLGPVEEAEWFLTNHRQPRHYEDWRAGRYPCVGQAHAVQVDGRTLLAVYRPGRAEAAGGVEPAGAGKAGAAQP